MASYILPIYGRSGQIVICIDIANILAEGGGVVVEGDITYWYGILAKPFGAPTFGTNRYLDDIYKQQQQQLTTLRRSPPLAHLIYDTFNPRQGERGGVVRRGGGSGSYVCMHANNTLTTFSRHS